MSFFKRCYLVPRASLPPSGGGPCPRLIVDGKEMTVPVRYPSEVTNYQFGWQEWPLDDTRATALVTIWWEIHDEEACKAWEALPDVVLLPELHEWHVAPVPQVVVSSLLKSARPVPGTFGELAKTLPWQHTLWELRRP